MSINKVDIIPADQKYAPPDQVVELAVIADPDHPGEHLIVLSVNKYEETHKGSVSTLEYNVPPLLLGDVIRALSAFSWQGQAIHFADIPTRLPIEAVSPAETDTPQ